MKIIVRFNVFKNELKHYDEKLLKEISNKLNKYKSEEDEYYIRYTMTTDDVEYEWIKNKCEEVYMDTRRTGIIGQSLPEFKYTMKDYSQAAAYMVNFQNFVDVYENDNINYYKLCCEDSKWYDGGDCGNQIRDYIVSKAQFKNKSYGILDTFDYVVNDNIKKICIKYGAKEEDFRPVNTKTGEFVCWQMNPSYILEGMGNDNNWTKIEGCLNCGQPTYIENRDKAIYISSKTLQNIKAFNKTKETFGRRFQSEIIINKDLYKALKLIYPRMRFEPIFLKE